MYKLPYKCYFGCCGGGFGGCGGGGYYRGGCGYGCCDFGCYPKKKKCPCVGPTGPIGPVGPTGATGATGATVATLVIAEFINSTTADTVANGAAVVFNSASTLSPIQYINGTSDVLLTEAGRYKVDFQVSLSNTGGGEWGIAVDGAVVDTRTFNTIADSSQIMGQVLVNVLTTATITLVNLSGAAATTSNGLAANPNSSISSSLLILKLQ